MALSWLESNLALNEVIYPSSASCTSSPSSPKAYPYGSATLGTDGPFDSEGSYPYSSGAGAGAGNLISGQTPTKETVALSSLSVYRPLSLSGIGSTYLHLVVEAEGGGSESRSTGVILSEQTGPYSICLSTVLDSYAVCDDVICPPLVYITELPLHECEEGKSEDQVDGPDYQLSEVPDPDARREEGLTDVSYRPRDAGVVQEELPHLSVSGCARASLYLLSPFRSASLHSLSECSLVIGAVAGVALLCNCEKVQLTVSCTKLVMRNCLDCDVRLACLSGTVISGDSRGIQIGEHRRT